MVPPAVEFIESEVARRLRREPPGPENRSVGAVPGQAASRPVPSRGGERENSGRIHHAGESQRLLQQGKHSGFFEADRSPSVPRQ